MVRPADSLAERAGAAVDLARRAATAYGRPDLVERLLTVRARLDDPRVRVLVVGEFKQGKSSLVNAVLGLEVCPIDDDIATAVPTSVQWAPDLAVTLVGRTDDAGSVQRRSVPPEDLPAWVTEAGDARDRDGLALVEVGLPATLLEGGLALVDTPGVGGLGSVHSAVTVATLPLADAVIFVSDAASELTEPELAFLSTVAGLCRRVLLVTTKTDLHPEWRKVHELDGIHLADAGLDVEQAAVSSALRELAIESDDRAVNAESGFPDLIRWLRDTVAGAAECDDAVAAADVVTDVAAQLSAQLGAERAAVADPARAAELVAALERAEADTDRARLAGSRWQQVLADGYADASSDIDRDLRLRLRELAASGETAIDALDPATGWAEFEPWLYQQVAAAAAEHLTARHGRLQAWIDDVAGAFGGDDAAAGLVVERDAAELLAGTGRDASLEAKRMRLGSQVFSLLRNSYSGIAMFGALGGIAGLVLSAPATVGIGLLLGGKGLREEKVRQLAQRRAQAKVSVRSYLEAVTFSLTNEQRDTLRATQRTVRDHFSARATEVHRTAAAALAAAKSAKGTDDADRGSRLAYLDGELAKVAVVADRAAALRRDAVEAVS
jgi:hypothetical protein